MPTDNDWLRRIHDLLGTGSGPGGITQAQVTEAIEAAILDELQQQIGLLNSLQAGQAWKEIIQFAIQEASNLQGLTSYLDNYLIAFEQLQQAVEAGGSSSSGEVQGTRAAGAIAADKPVLVAGADLNARLRNIRTTPEGYLQIQPTRPKFTNTYQFTGALFSEAVGALSGVVVQFVSGAAGATLDLKIPSPQSLPSVRLSVGERWELMHPIPAGSLVGVVSNASPPPLIYVTTFELWE
jgi:hypothetical protein